MVTPRPAKTCYNCGHTGLDVIERLEYVGGQGFVSVVECQNRTECWARWDRQHEPLYKNSQFCDEVADAVKRLG